MEKRLLFLIVFPVTLGILTSLACEAPVSQVQKDRIATEIGQTRAAAPPTEDSSQGALPSPLSPQDSVDSGQPSPTNISTGTTGPSPTITLTPTIILSATSSQTTVSVSVDTNCRSGPDVKYEYLGGILVGEVAEVVGKSSSGYHLVIKNPDRQGVCWISKQYATVNGSLDLVPVMTPPPPPPTDTPTPTITPTITLTPTITVETVDFTVSFDNAHACGGDTVLAILVKNTGNVPLSVGSYQVTGTGHGTSGMGGDFVGGSGDCPPGGSPLNPTASAYIAIVDNGAVIGESMTVGITLCKDGTATCDTKTTAFVMP